MPEISERPPSIPQVNLLFENFSQELEGVRAFNSAFALVELRPEDGLNTFVGYQDLVRRMGALTTEEQAIVEAADQKRQTGGSTNENAPNITALDVIGLFSSPEVLDGIVTRSIDDSRPAYSAAINDLGTRIREGHALKKAGHRLRGGDEESDKVLWTYTDMYGAAELLNYLVAHYIERYFAAELPDISARALDLATNKDFLLRGLTDALIIDHMSEDSQFSGIFDLWARPRDRAGMGWISADRLKSYGLAAD